MAKWVTENLENLLNQINEVPYTDDREKVQLSLLMNGFMRLNNQAMENAAVKTREHIRGWSLGEEEETTVNTTKKEPEVDELSRLRPIR